MNVNDDGVNGFEMQLLGPDVVERHHAKPAPVSRRYDPLGLPRDRHQCVHVTAYSGENGMETNRCTNTTHRGERHGWLCEQHDQETSAALVGFVPARDLEQELVEGIILSEMREIRKLRQ